MDFLADPLGAVQPYVHEYGFIAVFIILFLEAFGVPLPGESLLIAATLLASRGQMPLGPLVGVAYVATVMGDNAGYAIGRVGGRGFIASFGARLGLTSERLHKAESFFTRFGGTIVVFARFLSVLRQLNGLLAGTVAMPWLRFTSFSVIGAALWVGVWTAGPLLVEKWLQGVWPSVLAHSGFGAAAGALGSAGLALWWWRRRKA